MHVKYTFTNYEVELNLDNTNNEFIATYHDKKRNQIGKLGLITLDRLLEMYDDNRELFIKLSRLATEISRVGLDMTIELLPTLSPDDYQYPLRNKKYRFLFEMRALSVFQAFYITYDV